MTQVTRGLHRRLLSLDGGGFRGLSSLQILSRIMHRIKVDEGLAVTPRPCDYFDLIGGTSTGGIIALMLGRLRMSVEDAIMAYVKLGKKVFGQRQKPWKDGKFSAKALEDAIKHIIEEEHQRRQKEDDFREEEFSEDLKDPLAEQYMCRTFVCAVLASQPSGAGGPTLFRTYESRDSEDLGCNICEAARATSAAPSFFPAITVGRPGKTFIDAGLGHNNPASIVLEEAERIWRDQLDPRNLTIISIGTGHKQNSPLKPSGLPKMFGRYDVIKTLKEISTEYEATAQAAEKNCVRTGYTYFRFNVQDGLETIGLQEWNKQDEISASTDNYLGLNEISHKIDAAVERLKIREFFEQIDDSVKRLKSREFFEQIDDPVKRLKSRKRFFKQRFTTLLKHLRRGRVAT